MKKQRNQHVRWNSWDFQDNLTAEEIDCGCEHGNNTIVAYLRDIETSFPSPSALCANACHCADAPPSSGVLTQRSVEVQGKPLKNARVPFNSSCTKWWIVLGRADHLVRLYHCAPSKIDTNLFCLCHKTKRGNNKKFRSNPVDTCS